MKYIKELLYKLKKIQFIRKTYFLLNAVWDFFKFRPLLFVRQMVWFFYELISFKKIGINQQFKKIEYLPCLFDNLTYTPVEPTYFYQDSWAAKHIFEIKPSHHYDVGSSVKTMSIISQFVSITMIDIRPIEIELPGLYFLKGTILNLPFNDNSLES